MRGIMPLCKVYLESFIASRMSSVTGDNMGETRLYEFLPSGSDVLCALKLWLCSARAPANDRIQSATYWKLWPLPWQLLRAQGVPLSSLSHFYWQQLPGISWADNGDCSKKFLLKTYVVSGVRPGLLPSSQSLWLHSVSRVQCSLREDLAFSKVRDFFFFKILPFRKVLEVPQSVRGEAMSIIAQHTATFQSLSSVQCGWRVASLRECSTDHKMWSPSLSSAPSKLRHQRGSHCDFPCLCPQDSGTWVSAIIPVISFLFLHSPSARS